VNTKAVNAVLGLIADADGAVSVERYHADLLTAIAAVFPCEVLVFNQFQLDPRPARHGGHPAFTCSAMPPVEPAGAINPAMIDAFLRNMPEHPLIRLHAAGDRRAYRLSDVTSQRRFRRAALYGEFFGPAAIDHQLTFGLGGPPGPLVGVWVNRTRRDFSYEELLLAELLRPQLQAGEVAATRAVVRAALTPREREVLDLVATGASNAAVAEALVVSPGTVKKHLDNIYARLNVSSRAAAVARARAGPAAVPPSMPRPATAVRPARLT
jgi:DNA-binding CsgD family transcriptional regulator